MEHIEGLLSGYLDGMLAEAERRQVEAHLAACADCRRELGELKAASRLVASLPRKPLPAGFMERLRKRREAEGRLSSIPSWLAALGSARWAGPAALAFCALAAMVVVFNRAGRPPAVGNLQGMISGAASSMEQDEQASPAKTPAFVPSAATAPAYQAAAGAGGGAAGYDRSSYLALENAAAKARLPASLPAAAPQEPRRAKAQYLRGLAPQFDKKLGAGYAGAAGAGANRAATGEEVKERRASMDMLKAESETAFRYGFSIRSQAELKTLWRLHRMQAPEPSVDFARQMVILVRARNPEAEAVILDIKEENGRLIVLFKETALPKDDRAREDRGYRVVPSASIPVVFLRQP